MEDAFASRRIFFSLATGSNKVSRFVKSIAVSLALFNFFHVIGSKFKSRRYHSRSIASFYRWFRAIMVLTCRLLYSWEPFWKSKRCLWRSHSNSYDSSWFWGGNYVICISNRSFFLVKDCIYSFFTVIII